MYSRQTLNTVRHHLVAAALSIASIWLCAAQLRAEPPHMGSLSILDTETRSAGWTNSASVILALEGVRGRCTNLQICGEDTFTSVVATAYDAQLNPQIYTLPASDIRESYLTVSPDGTRAAALTAFGQISIWDLRNGHLLSTRSVTGGADGYEIAFSPTGAALAAIDKGGTLEIWDCAGGQKIGTYPHPYDYYAMDFNSDCSQLAVGDYTGRLTILDVATLVPLSSMSMQYTTPFTKLVFSPDGHSVLGITDQYFNRLSMFDIPNGQVRFEFTGVELDAAFSRDGTRIVTSDEGMPDVSIRDADTGAIISRFVNGADLPYSVAFTPDGSRVIVGGYYIISPIPPYSSQGTIDVWDIDTASHIKTITPASSYADDVVISPDGRQLLAHCYYNGIPVWDARDCFSYTVRSLHEGENRIYARIVNADGSSAITSATVNLDTTAPDRVTTPTVQGVDHGCSPVVFQWAPGVDEGSGILRYECQVGSAIGQSDILNATDLTTCTVSVEASINKILYCRVRAVDRTGNIGEWSDWTGPIMVADPDAPVLAGIEARGNATVAGGWCNSANIAVALAGHDHQPLWVDIDEDPAFGSPTVSPIASCLGGNIGTFPLYRGSVVSAVAWTRAPNQAVLGFSNGNLGLWDVRNAQPFYFVEAAHTGQISSVTVSPDGSRIMTVGFDLTVKIWETATGSLLQSFDGFGGTKLAATISPDGSRVATGSNMGAVIQQWSVQTGELLSTINTGCSSVDCLAFSPDGQALLSGAGSGEVKAWNAASGALIRVFTSPTYRGVSKLAYIAGGTQILIANGLKIQMYQAGTGSLLKSFLLAGADYGMPAALTSDESRIVVSNTTNFQVLSMSDGQLLRSFNLDHYCCAFALNPDDCTLLVGGNYFDNTLFDLRPRYAYTLDSGEEGLHTVYVRLRNYSGASETRTATVLLDLTAPTQCAQPTVNTGTFALTTSVFSWTAAQDSGSGIGCYEVWAGSNTTYSDLFSGRVDDAAVTITAQVGQSIYCRVRAIDKAGNVGAWSSMVGPIPVQYSHIPSFTRVLMLEEDSPTIGWTARNPVQFAIEGVTDQPEYVDFSTDPGFSQVTSVAFSSYASVALRSYSAQYGGVYAPDGQSIYLIYNSGINQHDVRTGALLRTLATDTTPSLRCVTLSRDGQKLYAGNITGQIYKWDVPTGHLDRITTTTHGRVYSIAIGGNDGLLVTGHADSKVCLWNAATGASIREWTANQYATMVDIDPAGQYVIAGSIGAAQMWNAQTGALIRSFGSNVRAVRFSPDGSKILIGDDIVPVLYDTATGGYIRSFASVATYQILYISFMPDGTKAVVSGHGSTLVDLSSGDERTYSFGATSQAVSPDGTQFIAFSSTACAKYDTRPTYTYTPSGGNGLKTVYVRLRNYAGSSPAHSVSFMWDTQPPPTPAAPVPVSTLSMDTHVTFNWAPVQDNLSDVVTYNYQIGTGNNAISTVLFSGNVGTSTTVSAQCPPGQTVYCRVASVDKIGNTSSWSNISTGVYISALNPPSASVQLYDSNVALNISHQYWTEWTDSPSILVGLDDIANFPLWVEMDDNPSFDSPTSATFTTTTNCPTKPLVLSSSSGTPVAAISPDGSTVAGTNFYINEITLYNGATGALMKHLTAYDTRSLLFSKDGRTLLALAGSINGWDVNSGQKIFDFSPSNYGSTMFDINANGTRILLGNSGASECVYNIAIPSGQTIGTINNSTGYIGAAAFLADGTVITVDSYNKICQWNPETGALIRTILAAGYTSTYVARISPDCSCALLGFSDHTDLINLSNGTCIRSFAIPGGEVGFSADSSRFFIRNNTSLNVFFTSTGAPVVATTVTSNCQYIRMFPDGKRALMCQSSPMPPLRLLELRPAFSYTLNNVEGYQTVYVRLRNHAGATVTSSTIGLDLTTPGKPGTPKVALVDHSTSPVTFTWMPAADTPAGIASYYCQVGTTAGGSDVYYANVGNSLSVTVGAAVGKTLYCRVRAYDHAGHYSAYSDNSVGVRVVATTAPSIGSVKLIDAATSQSGWTTGNLKFAVRGEANDPIWIDVSESADFSTKTTYNYNSSQLWRTWYGIPGPHGEEIGFTPDGQKLVRASAPAQNSMVIDVIRAGDGVIERSWTSTCSGLTPRLEVHPSWPYCLTRDSSGVFRVWNINTGELVTTAPYTAGFIADKVRFSPDGSLLLLIRHNTSVRLIDWATGQERWSSPLQAGQQVYSAALSPDNNTLVLAFSARAEVWDATTGVGRGSIEGLTDAFTSALISTDGQHVVLGDKDYVNVYDATTLALLSRTGSSDQYSFPLHPDGIRAVVGRDYKPTIMDLINQRMIMQIPFFYSLTQGAFSPDGSMLALIGYGSYDYNGDIIYNQVVMFQSMESMYDFALPQVSDGLHTIYIRLRNYSGTSQVIQMQVTVDRTPPSAPAAPVYNSGSNRFDWSAAQDSGSGVTAYQYEIGTSPGLSDIQAGTTMYPSATITGTVTGPIWCHVRAIDQMGNVGPWSAYNQVQTVWVKFDHTGDEDGSQVNPFNTVAKGVDAVLDGGTIRIYAGRTAAGIRINRPMRLEAWGGTATIGRAGALGIPSPAPRSYYNAVTNWAIYE